MIFKELLDKYCSRGIQKVALEELIKESTERNKNLVFSDVRSVSSQFGLISTDEFFDNSPASKNTSTYKVVRPSMFAYNPSRINIGSIAYSTLPLPVVVSPMYIVFSVDVNKINPQYLLYWIKSKKGMHEVSSRVEVGARFRLPLSSLKQIEIPLPPLSLQNIFVEKINTFATILSRLSEEINYHQKQYDYYKEKLFNEVDVDKYMMKIGSLFVFKNGLNKEKSYFGDGTPIVNYTDVYKNDSLTSDIIKGKVTLSEKEVERYSVKRGDVFFTRTSETPEEVGLTSVLLEDIEDCTFSGFLLRARPTSDVVLPEYCKYCFSTKRVRGLIKRYSTYTTRALTNGTSLSKIDIPVPPKDEQLRIVSILDTFSSLISKLEEERDLRQKQFEFYREKLLTFE